MSQPPVVKKGLLFWALPALAAVGFIWLFQAVLLPFVIGMAVAYLLNPWVNQLGREGLGRASAALLLLLTFLVVVAAALMLVVPALIRELNDLIRMLPYYWDKLVDLISPYISFGQENENGEIVPGKDIPTLIKENASSAAGIGKNIAGVLAAGGAVLTTILGVMVIAPIAAFFMVKDWPNILGWAQDLIPPKHRAVVLDLFYRMDRKIAGFVRGQLLVAVTLGAGYAIALSLIGLNYGLLIGLTAGILNLVPLLGSTMGLLIGVFVAWFQTGDWQFTGLIAFVFIAGQLIEGNFLTPKVLGDSVGMHPLWVFFSVLAGGSIAGIAGMLLAVPIAACAGVLLDYLIARYKESAYYKKPKAENAAAASREKRPKKRGL